MRSTPECSLAGPPLRRLGPDAAPRKDGGGDRWRRSSGWLAAAVAFALASSPACADPLEGAAEIVATVPNVAGDAVGAAGLLAAAGLASLGDGVALADRNPVTQGLLSAGIHRGAESLSWAGTSALEWLRREDVERWPEAAAAYRQARPFRGRLDTALSGGAALRVAVVDALLGPTGGLLRIVGAESPADTLERRRRESALFALGPPPADTAP